MKRSKPYSETLKQIASNIKRIRQKRGFTQEDMAEHGFNYRHYQKIESGKYSPSLQTLHRVAQALDVSLGDLIES